MAAERTLSSLILRLLLRAYPSSLRRDFGPEIEATFRRRLREARARGGWRPMLALWWRELVAALPHLPRRPFPGRRAHPMDTFSQDLRYALRTLRQRPGFTAAAVVALALGIGMAVAIFSVVNAVVLRPLPFPEPGQLVMLWESNPERGWHRQVAAAANFLDWQEGVEAFEAMAGYIDFVDNAALTGDGDPEMLTYVNVTGDFFRVLGVEPELGRGFLPAETWQGTDPTVVISHGLWGGRFGGDPEVVGRTLTLDGNDYTVVGVMPRDFRFPDPGVQVWAPTRWDPAFREQVWFRRAHWMRAIGRLRDGATLEEADRQLQVVAARLQRDHPETNALMGAGVTPLREFIVGDTRLALLVLLGATGGVLLIACANVASLLLARAAGRQREMAVRAALGAGRARILRQALTESLLLSVAGAALGSLLAAWTVPALAAMAPPDIPRLEEIGADLRVLGFAVTAALATALLFGLLPALRSASPELGRLHDDLAAGGRSDAAAAGSGRAGGLLVAAEVAIALALVVGAGLLARSLWEIYRVDPGFDPADVLTAEVSLDSSYQSRAQALGFFDPLLERIEGLPGVSSAAAVSALPLSSNIGWSSDFTAEGWPPDRYGTEVRHAEASPGYFRTMGIPLLRGRDFSPSDTAEGERVVVVSESVVERHFPGEDPIGRRVAFDRVADEDSVWRTIVGVVGVVKLRGLAETPAPKFYVPYAQDTSSGAMFIVVRTPGDPLELVGPVRQIVHDLDPDLPLFHVATLEQILRSSVARERFLASLLGLFAAVALVLAVVGVYGLTAYAVRRRVPEIGLRMALGARDADVVRMVLWQGMVPVGVGLVAGTALALAGARTLESLLFGVEPTDPLTFAAVATALAGAALAACWLPARRAARVDPLESLRQGG